MYGEIGHMGNADTKFKLLTLTIVLRATQLTKSSSDSLELLCVFLFVYFIYFFMWELTWPPPWSFFLRFLVPLANDFQQFLSSKHKFAL
jgi:hypothetical protein